MRSTLIPSKNSLHLSATTGLIALSLLAGCKSKDEAALDQAKSQAVTTNTPQQVQFIDSDGNTITDVVQPPATQGGKALVTTTKAPPAPGSNWHRTDPVIMPLAAGSVPQQGYAANTTQPAAGLASSQPAAQPSSQAAAINLTVPSGSELAIRINQHISVKTSRAGDRFDGQVVEPVTHDGNVLIPSGTPVSGVIDESHRRGHFKGRSILELRLVSMTLNGNNYPLDTHDSVRTKKGKGKRTAGFISGMTGAGMLIGGVATGGVGLAIGGAAGAGAGTLLAGATGNRDINIPAESVIHFRLADDLIIQN